MSESLREQPHHDQPTRSRSVGTGFDAATRSADDARDTLTCGVSLHRQGSRAWIRVNGQLGDMTRRHLDDWLDWLITTGAVQVTVSLATADQIDGACLLILRVARARLRTRNGELLVTAGRAQVRAALNWAAQPTGQRRLVSTAPATQVASSERVCSRIDA